MRDSRRGFRGFARGPFFLSVGLVLLSSALCGAQSKQALSGQNFNPSLVDPSIGTSGDGATIAGPSMPFGMIKPGPDVGNNDSNSGWQPSGDINGFSQTHVSGTGGGPKYGNILVQATTGAPQSSSYAASRQDERMSLGYYGVTLQRYQIRAEVAAARRAALYRFTYPAAQQANLLFDTGHCLTRHHFHFSWLGSSSPGSWRDRAEGLADRLADHYLKMVEAQYISGSEVRVVSRTEVAGSSSVIGGWNRQTAPYTVYFYAISDTPASSWGTWAGSRLHGGGRYEKGGVADRTGAWLSFPTRAGQQVSLKIGISFVSEEQAHRNALAEIPAFDFDEVRNRTIAAWQAALAPVELEGATPEQARMLYTALYHSMLMPVDRSGENPGWQSSEAHYDDFYTLWDTFRTTNPLLTLLAPERERDLLRSLVDSWQHEGWLPDGHSGNFMGDTQGGSDAEMVLGDAYVKHLPGIDWETAYAAMQKDAEVTPPDPRREGRGGIDDWKTIGYASIQGTDRPASKTMEYAANDYELALVARGLGRQEDWTRYRQRSNNWQNLWDAGYSQEGIRGFIRSRNRDGSWKAKFNATDQGTWGGDDFYEDNSFTYSLDVPHDVRGLIAKCGGRDAFLHRLDAFFNSNHGFDPNNEPGFLTPYLYIWAGRQDKTAATVRRILAASYGPRPDGIPGNDDAGAISSWLAFGLIGIYPNAGQDVYLIGSPAIPKVTLHLAGDKTFTIEAEETAEETATANPYIQSATLNGQPLNRAWLTHEEITAGGRIVFKMGPKPADWATGTPPPSSSDPQAVSTK